MGGRAGSGLDHAGMEAVEKAPSTSGNGQLVN